MTQQQLSEEGRRLLKQGANECRLLALNDYALENKLISAELHHKLQQSIRMDRVRVGRSQER